MATQARFGLRDRILFRRRSFRYGISQISACRGRFIESICLLQVAAVAGKARPKTEPTFLSIEYASEVCQRLTLPLQCANCLSGEAQPGVACRAGISAIRSDGSPSDRGGRPVSLWSQ